MISTATASPSELSLDPERDVADAWVERPWGAFQVLGRGRGYQVKRVRVDPGGVLSLQHHRHRAEHWIVVSGRGSVQVDGARWQVGPDDAVRVPAGAIHRLANAGDQSLLIIEVQSGEYLGEDDIVRHEDVYGRAP